VRSRGLIGILAMVALLCSAYATHQSLSALDATYPTEFRSYYIPSSGYMKVASLGQESFWADLIFIWSIQYFDMYAENVRDSYLYHTYDVITDLDPRFEEAYVFGDLFLSLDKRWSLIYKLADKSLSADSKMWLPAWDAGTYAFFSAHDYPSAQKYFTAAYNRNPRGTIIQRMLANALKYAGQYESALEYWTEILKESEGKDDSWSRFLVFTARHNMFDLTIKIDLRNLKAAVDRCTAEKGSAPKNLESLVKAGYLPSVPVDPEGKPYLYNSRTGEVACQSPFKYKGKFGQW
jgi:tetratricopeptide (TPR) repeat protein